MNSVIDKVRKLLRLAESPNANEAALAAAKAQSLIDEHNLSAALLAMDGGPSEPDEDIEDFMAKDAPLDRQPILHRWRQYLASTIARANGCRIYSQGGNIALVGRPSDAETVRYLFAYLTREVDRLCEKDGKGCGRTWRNNYRLGVVDTISKKLRAERERFVAEQRKLAAASGNSQALVRLDGALAKVDKRGADVAAWVKSNLRLVSGGGSSSRYDSGAREAGRKAGQSISLNGARKALAS